MTINTSLGTITANKATLNNIVAVLGECEYYARKDGREEQANVLLNYFNEIYDALAETGYYIH